MCVQDVDRPDVDGKGPKMAAVCNQVKEALDGLIPSLRVSTSDNFCSTVDIWGSHEAKEEWPGKIWENSSYFSLTISPIPRYYTEGDRVTVKLSQSSYTLKNSKLRKYTGPVEKVIAKIITWIESNK